MATSKVLLQAMNLTKQDTTNDLFIKNKRDCPYRKKFQEEILKSELTENKPESPDLWAVEDIKICSNPVPTCQMHVAIAIISATISAGNNDGTPKEIPKEYILPKEQAAEWSLENIYY